MWLPWEFFPFTHTSHQNTFGPLQLLTLSMFSMKELSFLLWTYSCPTITEAESIELNFHFALLATSVCSESIRNKTQISVSPFAPQALPRFITNMDQSDSPVRHHAWLENSTLAVTFRLPCRPRRGLPSSDATLYIPPCSWTPGEQSFLGNPILPSPKQTGWASPTL